MPTAAPGGGMFDTVVVATDGSASGERAVATAVELAADFDAAVHALSVVDGEVTARDRARAALDAVESLADGEVVRTVREGDPAAEIRAYAEAVDADLVAMGTRGRGGDSFHLGSVAERVVEGCPVPVLTVRQLDPDARPSA